jgi:hypothetical protein
MSEYLAWDVVAEGTEKVKPLIAEIAKLTARKKALEALLREVVTSIEFDELGLGTLREKIERLLVKP